MSDDFISKLCDVIPIKKGVCTSRLQYHNNEYGLVTTNHNKYGSIGEVFTEGGLKYGVVCLCPALLPYNDIIDMTEPSPEFEGEIKGFNNEQDEEE